MCTELHGCRTSLTTDIWQVYESLKANGVKFLSDPKSPGSRLS